MWERIINQKKVNRDSAGKGKRRSRRGGRKEVKSLTLCREVVESKGVFETEVTRARPKLKSL